MWLCHTDKHPSRVAIDPIGPWRCCADAESFIEDVTGCKCCCWSFCLFLLLDEYISVSIWHADNFVTSIYTQLLSLSTWTGSLSSEQNIGLPPQSCEQLWFCAPRRQYDNRGENKHFYLLWASATLLRTAPRPPSPSPSQIHRVIPLTQIMDFFFPFSSPS